QIVVRVADGKALLLGASPKVGDVSCEPKVLITRTPKTKAAGRGLHFIEARNRFLDGGLCFRLFTEMRARGDLFVIKQRQGLARGLLGAAERIAVEAYKQARYIEGGRAACGHRNLRGGGHQVADQLASDP